MLPEDAKLHMSATLKKDWQLSVTDHFSPEDMDTRPIPYSNETFRNAAIEWLVETNQVCPLHILTFILNKLHVCSLYRHLAEPHSRT